MKKEEKSCYLELIVNKACEEIIKGKFYQPSIERVNKLIRVKIIINRLIGKEINYKISWPSAFLFNALTASYVVNSQKIIHDTVSWYVNLLLKETELKKMQFVDEVMNGYSLMVFDDIFDDIKSIYKVHDLVNFLLKKHKRSVAGVIPYRQRHPQMIFVDTIGMICPFLARYGYFFKNNDSTDLSLRQITDFFDCGIDEKTGLPYHAYNRLSLEKKGMIGWGRGVGWLLYGIADALEYYPDSINTKKIIFKFQEMIDTISSYQNIDGSFSCNLLDQYGHIDMSATAMIGYAVAKAVSIGAINCQYINIANQAYAAIVHSTSIDGSILNCSDDCGGIGKQSVIFGNYPWGQAAAISLATLMV